MHSPSISLILPYLHIRCFSSDLYKFVYPIFIILFLYLMETPHIHLMISTAALSIFSTSDGSNKVSLTYIMMLLIHLAYTRPFISIWGSSGCLKWQKLLEIHPSCLILAVAAVFTTPSPSRVSSIYTKPLYKYICFSIHQYILS